MPGDFRRSQKLHPKVSSFLLFSFESKDNLEGSLTTFISSFASLLTKIDDDRLQAILDEVATLRKFQT